MEWIKSTWESAREAVNNKLEPATGETFEDNRWTRAMRDELGINVTYKWVADGAQAQEKLKLAMASGDLPDVITLEGGQRLVDFQQLAEADLLADMTDLWEQWWSGSPSTSCWCCCWRIRCPRRGTSSRPDRSASSTTSSSAKACRWCRCRK